MHGTMVLAKAILCLGRCIMATQHALLHWLVFFPPRPLPPHAPTEVRSCCMRGRTPWCNISQHYHSRPGDRFAVALSLLPCQHQSVLINCTWKDLPVCYSCYNSFHQKMQWTQKIPNIPKRNAKDKIKFFPGVLAGGYLPLQFLVF